MDFKEEDIELFDCYLKGEMTSEERINFEKRIESDSEFKHSFNQYLFLVEGIKQSARQELKQLLDEKGKVRYIKNVWGKNGTWISAAIFLFFISLYFVFESNFMKNMLYTDKNNSSIAFDEGTSAQESVPFESFKKKEPLNNKDDFSSNNEIKNRSNDDLNADISNYLEEELQEEIIADESTLEDSTQLANMYVEDNIDDNQPIASSKSTIMKSDNEDEVLAGRLLLDSVYLALHINNEMLNNKNFVDKFEETEVRIQYWVSPLNSKVYKYTHNNGGLYLEVYGIHSEEILKVFLNDNFQLMLLGDKKVYVFQLTSDYQNIKINKDQNLINSLILLNEN